jgi:hypothetical protein
LLKVKNESQRIKTTEEKREHRVLRAEVKKTINLFSVQRQRSFSSVVNRFYLLFF